MKFSTAFSAALLASGISAAAIKPTRTRHTHPNMRKPSGSLGHNTNRTANDQSGNWAGGVLTAPPSGQTFNAVSGSFVVPQPSIPDGADPNAGPYTGTAWVGIDGDTYQGAILQAGVDWSVDGSGNYQYFAWTEWIPDAQVPVDGLTINSGDSVNVQITSQSDTTGTVVITDETTGQSVTTSISAPNAEATLQGVNAEWIVEDYTISTGLAPFANYGSVALTDCAAGTPAGSVDGTGADLLDMTDSSGNVISATVQASGSEFDVTYQ